MRRSLSTWPAILALPLLLLGACSGGGGDFTPRTPAVIEPPPTAVVTPTAWPTPAEPPTELKVAYINLLRPDALDETNTLPSDTLLNRLAIITEELQVAQPDIVVISQATIDGNVNVVSALASALRMEPWFALANPWPRGYSYDEASALARENGLLMEGDAILVRSSRYRVVTESFEVKGLNPLAAPEERRSAMHLVIAAEGIGEIDLYATRLTGGTDENHAAQTRDLLRWIERTRGEGPVLLLGDFAETPESATYAELAAAGLISVASLPGIAVSEGTCCRSNFILPEPEPLTEHTSYIFTDSTWFPDSVTIFGNQPRPRPDGTLLYASSHNGIFARFALVNVNSGSVPLP
jgi:endonuclease/exonuclease/phosphatase family metal-dependent hydrolase